MCGVIEHEIHSLVSCWLYVDERNMLYESIDLDKTYIVYSAMVTIFGPLMKLTEQHQLEKMGQFIYIHHLINVNNTYLILLYLSYMHPTHAPSGRYICMSMVVRVYFSRGGNDALLWTLSGRTITWNLFYMYRPVYYHPAPGTFMESPLQVCIYTHIWDCNS